MAGWLAFSPSFFKTVKALEQLCNMTASTVSGGGSIVAEFTATVGKMVHNIYLFLKLVCSSVAFNWNTTGLVKGLSVLFVLFTSQLWSI